MTTPALVPGPLHPDLFGGETPVMMPFSGTVWRLRLVLDGPLPEVLVCAGTLPEAIERAERDGRLLVGVAAEGGERVDHAALPRWALHRLQAGGALEDLYDTPAIGDVADQP